MWWAAESDAGTGEEWETNHVRSVPVSYSASSPHPHAIHLKGVSRQVERCVRQTGHFTLLNMRIEMIYLNISYAMELWYGMPYYTVYYSPELVEASSG